MPSLSVCLSWRSSRAGLWVAGGHDTGNTTGALHPRHESHDQGAGCVGRAALASRIWPIRPIRPAGSMMALALACRAYVEWCET